ncbi:MAG TPA: patatin-like phospholipase family protein [Dokdonella sp.]|uniref:patatin-like phospholipase family protein n=1 Tax=Dokdonella sp. TaxID=2291710 RepID=UPI0025C6545B|nr:patatin-like phospholipase family protein [Dokdonella sp.]HNR91044.1 patatin-like phospholipase family protein [Dokdonella sp.]
MHPHPLRDMLHSLPLFRPLDEAALAGLEHELQYFALPGGAVLFEQGEESDALYVLKSGSLGAFRSEGTEPAVLVGTISAGETVGEVGLLLGTPRNATARALRDSELLRLSRADFEKLIEHHPQAMFEAARQALRRVNARGTESTRSAPRTLAVLPHDDGVDAHGFAKRLVAALQEFGETILVDAALGLGQLSTWFGEIEERTRFVVYVADGDVEWKALCRRQADAVLLLADAASEPVPWSTVVCPDAGGTLAPPCQLVLLHRGTLRNGAARRWLALTPGLDHHHVREARDVRRIARLLTGRSLGLVLSGGGARGFAQIGVVRALREAGLEIDRVGGTSIGSIIGAGVALEWSDEEMLDNYRRAFVAGRPLSDYTLPLVALTRGARVAHLLRAQFGARDITDLVLPFYCCSANLSTGHLDTHLDGPLWLWLRASCAIPGVLPPVLHGGQVHVDGAVINNLPTDVMAARHAGAIAAIDISAGDVLHSPIEEFATPSWWRLLLERRSGRRPGIVDILVRSGMVNAERASDERRALANLLLAPPVRETALLDWRAYDRTVEAGYQYALRIIGGRKDGLYEQVPVAV